MIKDDLIKYRNINPMYRTLLGTVLGELDRISKNPTDEQCIQVIKKMIESNNEVNSNDTLEENFVLAQFLPSQLNEEQINDIIKENNFSSIKDCMMFFKTTYTGKYDGKLVSKIFNSK